MKNSDVSSIGYFFGFDKHYPGAIKQKTKKFPFCPENKFSHQDKFSDYMKEMKANNYTQNKKSYYDWTDKKNYLNLQFFYRTWNNS